MAPRDVAGPRAPYFALAVMLGSIVPGSADAAPPAGPTSLEDPTADRPVPIIGGEPTALDEYVQVVAVVAGTGLCTGTLVTKNLVLTAAHCLANVPPDAQVAVFYGDALPSERYVAATQWGAHPDFCAECDDDIHDYGYVVTDANFNPPFARPITTQQEWDETMKIGGEVTLVGYGLDPNADDNESLGRKREVTTTITDFSPAGLEFKAGGNQKDSCEGDSGGPAFVTLPDGSLLLAGITSRGSNPCGDGGVYGAPYPALCWVREQTGIDLLDGSCSACDCVDMAPEQTADDKGCRIAPDHEGERGPAWALALLGLLAVLRRRR